MKFLLALLILLLPASALGQSFDGFLAQVAAAADSASRSRLVEAYLSQAAEPVIEGSTVTFLYAGKGESVSVPSELNQWNPAQGRMRRVAGTDLFFRSDTLPLDARLEYKLWVDSSWMLDPRNPRRAAGGYGENSDVWMPRYVQSVDSRFTPGIRHGRVDTLRLKSAKLGHAVPVYVYTPPGRPRGGRRPVLYVTDGGDYLTLGRLDVILDNLLAARKITPLVAVFIDPRSTTPAGEAKDYRMTEYAANDAFLQFLESELAPLVEKRFGASDLAEQRVILGASLGGIIATYAVLQRPNFITNCAAQSPAYYYRDSTLIKLAQSRSAEGRYVYMSTGTIHDTEAEATIVAEALRAHGAQVTFERFHEGHNWTNWRARLPKILETFFHRK